MLANSTTITAPEGGVTVAHYLAENLRARTGLPLPVVDTAPDADGISLELEAGHVKEGYSLSVTSTDIQVRASDPAGLFAAVQTLRQLVVIEPTSAESTNAESTSAEPTCRYAIWAQSITDYPRFAYRGAMLDVARHFFSVDDVKRYIDAVALLKFNVLHLHLTDDQGWRLEIKGWPNLTEYGGSTQVGGGGGGFYTQNDYREIVAHAQSRFVTIVPEIDVPGHTNAALASYPELTCDGKAPALYEGIEVGFSSLCISKERTYEFVADVLDQVAALTPGPWIHIGGDEALSTPEADYLRFIERASTIAVGTGKSLIGWHEMGRSPVLPMGTLGEYWNFTEPEGDAALLSMRFIERGGRLIMAPADVAYLDMKYEDSSPLGLVWAKGPTSLERTYDWDPAAIIPGVGDEQIIGVEAPLWTETLTTLRELTTMAFPRIAAIAEIAWSPRRERNFAEFATRVAALGTHLEALDLTFHRTPNVPWG